MIGVYKITNTITNDCYIGSSKNVEWRMNYHKYASVWKHNPTKVLYKAFQQYGIDNFTFETIETTSLEDRHSREQYWISQLKPVYNTYCTGIDTSDKKEYQKEYCDQLCNYNGEVLTLNALNTRFSRMGIAHPTVVAKTYLVKLS